MVISTMRKFWASMLLWPSQRVGMVKESFCKKWPSSFSWSCWAEAIYYLTLLIPNNHFEKFLFHWSTLLCTITFKYLSTKISDRPNQTSRYCWEGKRGLGIGRERWEEVKGKEGERGEKWDGERRQKTAAQNLKSLATQQKTL